MGQAYISVVKSGGETGAEDRKADDAGVAYKEKFPVRCLRAQI